MSALVCVLLSLSMMDVDVSLVVLSSVLPRAFLEVGACCTLTAAVTVAG